MSRDGVVANPCVLGNAECLVNGLAHGSPKKHLPYFPAHSLMCNSSLLSAFCIMFSNDIFY